MRRLAIAVSSAGVASPLADASVRRAVRRVLVAERVRDAMVSVALVSTARITALNARHLRHRRPTDVIAFGLSAAGGGPVVGDVYVAPRVAEENARRHGVSAREEVLRLVVHGTLHVLGYDHPAGPGRTRSDMWRRQERIVAGLVGGGAR